MSSPRLAGRGVPQALQGAITMVHDWSLTWDLPHSKEKESYVIDGISIQKVDHIRDLGFLITKDLSFGKHCDVVVSKATKVVHTTF
ncbi:hypothetical protein ANCCAN_12163 [Ancylostoma caninum]|uniref:Uncharacterized protein n=1 Tax=Ancylostoma caninum TaxID=29170 RepID=A0A368GFT1_ANCCA|nr:hypothetical protein ANCCAN_12163 [Ancylostoma caninum]